MYRIKHKKSYDEIGRDEILCHHHGLSNYIFQNDVFEKSMIDWCILQYKNPEKVFVDIGAHIGTYTWSLAPHFKHTYAFEPNKSVYNVLCGNIAIKRQSEIIDTHCIGISDKKDTLTYYNRSHDGGMNGFSQTEMPVSNVTKLNVNTLDSFEIDNIGLIKVDVEGHELEVLGGMHETIKRNNYPPIIFESWQPGMHPEFDDNRIDALRKSLLNEFNRLGYQTTQLSGYPEMFLATRRMSREESIKVNLELDIWINSPGGCRTNMLADTFEKRHKVKSQIWHDYACHFRSPVESKTPKYLFCYTNDIGIAITSQIHRNIRAFDKAVKRHRKYDMKLWLEIIESQIDEWSTSKLPIYLLNTDSLNQDEIRELVEKEFDVVLPKFKQRKTTKYHPNLDGYKKEISRINKKLQSLPNFRKPL